MTTNDLSEEETKAEPQAAGTTSTLPAATPKPKPKKKGHVHPNNGWEANTPPPEPLVD